MKETVSEGRHWDVDGYVYPGRQLLLALTRGCRVGASGAPVLRRPDDALKPEPIPGVSRLGDFRYPQGGAGIAPAAQIAEQILDRVLPGWRREIAEDKKGRWQQHRQAAQRAIAQLEREAELRDKLGDNAPRLDAGQLHTWVWEGARSLWQSGHYREAVRAASVKVNAEAQNKLGVRDLAETPLFQMAFSNDEPSTNRCRLRLPGDDGGRTAMSLRRGVMAFAEGCYAAIRNPASHDVQAELPEHEALEQLAAFSVLARWIDLAEVRGCSNR